MSSHRTILITQFLEAWGEAHRSLAGNRDQYFASLGLNRAQVELLFSLAHTPNMTIKETAMRLNTSSSAATQLVNGLVEDGLLERLDDQLDHRSVRLSLTRLGQERIDHCRAGKVSFLTILLKDVTDKEIETLISVAGRINKNRVLLQTQKEYHYE